MNPGARDSNSVREKDLPNWSKCDLPFQDTALEAFLVKLDRRRMPFFIETEPFIGRSDLLLTRTADATAGMAFVQITTLSGHRAPHGAPQAAAIRSATYRQH